MEYRNFTIQGKEVHLYPLVCWHLGAKQSDAKFIGRVIETIKADPLARWIYMGDAGECNIKESKGDLYSQTMNPGDQLEAAIGLLEPIQEKGLFGISGNHGHRIYRATGVDWDKTLCERVGVPYCGTSCLFDLGFSLGSKKDRRWRATVSVYVHHGVSGSTTVQGKVAAGKKPEVFVQSDVILTAHSHACGPLPCPRHYAYTSPANPGIKWGTTYSFLCGSGYDSRTGYAETKLYPPIMPEHLVVAVKVNNRTYKPEISSWNITAF